MEITILKKASELFITYGFKNVTMDEIANDLGISKKTIYVYYENKSELVEAVVNYLFNEIKIIIEDIKNLQLNPIEESFKTYGTVSQLLKDEKISIDFQLKKYFPEIYDRINCTKSEILQKTITDNLNRGINEGLYRPTIDTNFTSKYFLTTITSFKNYDYFEIGEIDITYAMKQIFELYFRSIVTEKGLIILEQNINREN
ncbi:MAG: TetR/AcrR family transcriptional regulator [Flavobacteriaceae bacterium]|nr:TetR/AcrR family transcriptional regulator [Flavobacteriaceae bacterium]